MRPGWHSAREKERETKREKNRKREGEYNNNTLNRVEYRLERAERVKRE